MEKIWLKLFSVQKIDKNKSFLKKHPPQGFCKKVVHKKFHKIHVKTLVLESLFNRVSALRPASLFKKRLFSGKFCEICKNTFFTERVRNLSRSFISQRSLIYLFKSSFVRKMDKAHNFAIFSFCQYILYSIVNVFYRSKHKHMKSYSSMK